MSNLYENLSFDLKMNDSCSTKQYFIPISSKSTD